VFQPGWCDLEQFEDAALGVCEAVQLDAGTRVGEAEALEDCECVARGAKGVRNGRKCVAPPRRKTKARSCTRHVKVATVRATLKAGPAKLKLPAKVRRTKGTYTIALMITDAAGNAATTKTTFRVAK
jgi:hypothetical protein